MLSNIEHQMDKNALGLIDLNECAKSVHPDLIISEKSTIVDPRTFMPFITIALTARTHSGTLTEYPVTLENIEFYPEMQTITGIKFNIRDFSSGLLSLLKLKNLQRISSNLIIPADEEFRPLIIKAINIVHNHLKEKNILACQEELMDNGLKQYAKF